MQLKQIKVIAAEKRDLKKLTNLLSLRMRELIQRNEEVSKQLGEINRIWESKKDSSHSTMDSFVTLRAEIAHSSEAYMRELTVYQSAFQQILSAIRATPKSDFDGLLDLYGELRSLCLKRLEIEIPHREEITDWREETIEKLRVIAES
jgi:hypothetical protein